MAIEWTKTIVSLAVGIGDDYFVKADADAALTDPTKADPFKGMDDWVRTVIFGVGLAAQSGMIGALGRWGDVLTYSAAPLFAKSISRKAGLFASRAGRPSATARDYIPTRRPAQASQRYPAPETPAPLRKITPMY